MVVVGTAVMARFEDRFSVLIRLSLLTLTRQYEAHYFNQHD